MPTGIDELGVSLKATGLRNRWTTKPVVFGHETSRVWRSVTVRSRMTGKPGLSRACLACATALVSMRHGHTPRTGFRPAADLVSAQLRDGSPKSARPRTSGTRSPRCRAGEDERAVVIERGEGTYLFDTDGTRYIDGVSSLWCNVHGHRHPAHRRRGPRPARPRRAHDACSASRHPPAHRAGATAGRDRPAGPDAASSTRTAARPRSRSR